MKATAATEIAATELTASNAELTATTVELTATTAERAELTATTAELHANAKIMVDVSELVIALHREPCSPSTLNRFLNVKT